MENNKGLLMIISGPSGSGKGTICAELNRRRKDVEISISATSRTPRTEDTDGKSYYFKTEHEFKEMIEKDELLEWVMYCGNYYGTPKQDISKRLNEGMNVILEIEVNGALNVKKRYPQSILIFIIPPNYENLIARLKGRASEDEASICRRIKRAFEEVQAFKDYDYLIVNDTVSNAVFKIEAIIEAERSKANRNQHKLEQFIKTFKEAE